MAEKKTVPGGTTEQEKKMEPDQTAEPKGQGETYPEPDENWAHETVQELLDFWEEQGVYIRE